MPVYTLAEGLDGTQLRINGEVVAVFTDAPSRVPLFTTELRQRPLNSKLLAGPKLKIARARQHLAELEATIGSYLAGQPVQITQTDDEAGAESLRAKLLTPPPNTIIGLVGDALHNVRSALDILVCDLIRANGQDPTRDSCMPLVVGGVTGADSSRLRGMSERARRVIARLTQTPRWNEPLVSLHRLDISDKHDSPFIVASATAHVRTLVAVPGMFIGPDGSMRMGGPGPGGQPFFRDVGVPAQHTVFVGEEQVVEVHRFAPGFVQQVQLAFGLVFAPGLPNAGRFVTDVIHEAMLLVERICVLCERRNLLQADA